MSDDGTSFEIDLPVTGKERVDAATASLDVLAAKQDQVSKALVAASDAVKASEASYKRAEQTADRAAKAMERIGVAADAQRGKLAKAMDTGDDAAAKRASATLANLSDRQAEATAKAATMKAALLSEAAALDKLRENAAKLNDAKSKLDTAVDRKTRPKAEEASDGPAYETIARGLRKLGGPLAEVGEKVSALGSGFGKLKSAFGGTAGAIVGVTVLSVALVAAFVAVAAAAANAVVRVAEWAVTLADANRESSLLAQGMVQSVKGGELLNAEIKAMAKTLPVTNDELAGMAKNFAYAGYRGKDLQNALLQSARWAARVKFGPDFAKQMLSLNEQSKVLKANIAATFGGLKIDGLLGGLQKVLALFDDTTASGQAIKVVFESIFQPMINAVDRAQDKIERFFILAEIAALKALIAIKPYGSTIMTVVEALALGAAVIAGVVVAAFAALAVAVTVVVAAFGALIAGAFELGQAVRGLIDTPFAVVIDRFAAIGSSMIDGLVNGIVAAGSKVFNALKGIVMSAVAGVYGLLKINSPSKVFAAIGMSTGEGMALGVNRSSGHVQDAMESMAEPPSGRDAMEKMASAVRGAPSRDAMENMTAAPARSFTPPKAAQDANAATANPGSGFAGAIFNLNLHGVKDAEDATGKIRDAVLRLFEGEAASIGGAGFSPA